MPSDSEGPITGLCIVSDPEKCPPGYELIYKSNDKRDDCDLWKDGFFRSKVTRYLCITRVFPLDGGRLNNVLSDIAILNEREPPLTGFSLLDKTVDTGEQATKKKTIAVQMVNRNTCHNAICDLIILSKSKRAPMGYTLIAGDLNGLTLCYKIGVVPPDTKTLTTTNSLQQSPSFDSSAQISERNQGHFSNLTRSNHYQVFSHQQPTTPVAEHMGGLVTRQESVNSTHSGNAVHDVPFQLNVKLQNNNLSQEDKYLEKLHVFLANLCIKKNLMVPTITFKSLTDIENQYSYPFRLERSMESLGLESS